MKSKPVFTLVALVTLICLGTGLPAVWAQEAKVEVPAKVKPRSSGVSVHVDSAAIQKQVADSLAAADMQAEIRTAAEKLRDAPDEKTKIEAHEKLITILVKCFDEDMARREKELMKLKQRLNKLAAQLEHRRDKKKEIIDLQVKVAVNEADGLGFISHPAHPFSYGFDFAEGPMMHVSHGDAYMALPTPPQPQPKPAVDADAKADADASAPGDD